MRPEAGNAHALLENGLGTRVARHSWHRERPHPPESGRQPMYAGARMRKKLLNLVLILTSLIGYLEWGQGQSVFLFQAEADLFMRALRGPRDVVHPFTLLPVLGQATLAWTLSCRSWRWRS